MSKKITRCAVYTRKSSEEGLEQDFNSLDAQREAGEAYIKSQKHEGWELIATKYDDGGYSGGNMDRPALKLLLADISAGKVDVIVVYKVDRLSRALSDFAKMVEVFDKHNVSFVSVTQQFNTTTSMGRLTLNVLLSFAQFEREVTGERIRDKITASKKKGMWMGGPVPLGYDVKDRKLIVNKSEAEIIRYIFEHFANKPVEEPLWKLLKELKSRNYMNKSWISTSGNQIIGKEFNLKQVWQILNNQVYNGKISHKGQIYAGEHQEIINEELWKKVHSKISKKEFVKNSGKQSEQPKLVGKIYDYLDNRLSPTYSYKYSSNGRYKMRYYVNRQICTTGKTNSEFKRIRADYIDNIVEAEIRLLIDKLIKAVSNLKSPELASAVSKQLHDFKFNPAHFLSKIILFPDHLELNLTIKYQGNTPPEILTQSLKETVSLEITLSEDNQLNFKINIPVQYKKFGSKFCIITNSNKLSEADIDKEYYHTDDKTFTFIAKAFYWSKLIRDGVYKNSSEIAKAQNHSKPYVKRALRQRYLSPKMIKRVTNNDNDKQIGVDQLINLNNWCWKEQEKSY